MTAEFGHFALILAFAVALVQSVVPLVGAQKRWSDWMAMAAPAAGIQFALIALSFAALTRAFVTSDFSVALVARHSNSLKPMLYKVSGVWGNHEGSMLLWVLVLALFGALVAPVRTGTGAGAEGADAQCASHDRCGLSGVRPVHIEPVRATRPSPRRRRRPEPAVAGSRIGVPSAVSLSGLCRALDRVLLRGRRTDRGACGRRLGALGAALGAAGLDHADHRHRAWVLLGLLRAGLGRLVVLGSG